MRTISPQDRKPEPGKRPVSRKGSARKPVSDAETPKLPAGQFRVFGGAVFTADGPRIVSYVGNGDIFMFGSIADNAGKILSRAIAFYSPKDKAVKILWEGDINVLSTQLEYKPLGDRSIDPQSARRSITMEATDRMGRKHRHTITASVSRDTRADASVWLDPLGILNPSSPAMVGKLIRILAEQAQEDSRISIRSQGPIFTDTGDWILVSLSGAYDTDGNIIRGYRANLDSINPATLRLLHDVLPPDEITPDMITGGLAWAENFLSLSRECADVPAAHLGQLITSVLAPIDIRYWSAIYLHAPSTLGKTEFEKLVSAVQSPAYRNARDIRPELNLGDSTGSNKGPKYRVPAFGLGTIFADDVFKESESAVSKALGIKRMDDLIRSHEEGAGALGKVDRSLDDVVGSASGELCASIRFTAEGPPPIVNGKVTSTFQRVIIQGGWTKPWHEVFDRDKSRILWQTLDNGYAGYSYMTHWVWTHADDMDILYHESEEITAKWNCEQIERVRGRYTGIVCGLLVLREIAAEQGYTFADAGLIAGAIDGLRAAAERQAGTATGTVDLAHEFLREAQLALADGAIAAVGRPVLAKHAVGDAYISPFIREQDADTGNEYRILPAGANRLEDMGLRTTNQGAEPKRPDAVQIFVRPPRATAQGGRGAKDALRDRWTLLAPVNDGTWERLCRTLTARRSRIDGIEFDPVEVETALKRIYSPVKAKIRYYAIPDPDSATGGIGKEDSTSSPQSAIQIPTDLIWTGE